VPDKLERQLHFLSMNPQLCVVHSDLEFMKDGKVLPDALDRRHLVRDGNIFEQCLLLHCWAFLSTLLVQRSVLDDVGLFNESLYTAEDTNLFLRIARKYQFGFINAPLVKRRIHESNMTVVGTNNYGTFKNLEHIARLYPELEVSRSTLMRRAYERRYLLAGCSNFRSGQYTAARPFLLKAMRLRLFNFKTVTYLILTFFPGASLDALRRIKGQLRKALKGRMARYQVPLW
jgi:hypothetical protein